MKRFCAVMAVWMLAIGGLTAWSQTATSGSQGTGGNQNSSGRGPSDWVHAALARHEALIDARVNGPRNGQIPSLPQSSGSGGSSGLLGSLSSLLPLLGQFGSGGGSSTDLTSLLGGLSGGTG